MKLMHQSFEILTPIDGQAIMGDLERAARTCYKSEDRIGPGTANKLVQTLVDRGHHAMLEHAFLQIKFITDRGVTHELVRHRIASFAQESTRYCNYSKGKFGGECTFIIPSWTNLTEAGEQNSVKAVSQFELDWFRAMGSAEAIYLQMIENGASPQEARSVLPNSLKTEIVVTANLREWMHIMTLRAAKTAHPQMQDLMLPLLGIFKTELPILFSHIGESNNA